MKVIIGKDGNVESAELISGHPLLAPAALDAVKQWKFKPYLLNGNPIEVESQIQVNFDW
jgi:protein TonB